MKTQKAAFTVIELCIAMVIAAMMLALAIPALATARAKSREEICQDNLAAAGKAFVAYSKDFKGFLPPLMIPSRVPWQNQLNKYMGQDGKIGLVKIIAAVLHSEKIATALTACITAVFGTLGTPATARKLIKSITACSWRVIRTTAIGAKAITTGTPPFSIIILAPGD